MIKIFTEEMTKIQQGDKKSCEAANITITIKLILVSFLPSENNSKNLKSKIRLGYEILTNLKILSCY